MRVQAVSAIFMLAAMFGASGCGGGASANSFQAPSSSDGSGGTGGTGGGGTGGTISSLGMYVTVAQASQPVVTYLHQFYNFGNSCSIATGTSAVTDLQCLLNVQELDLYAQGLTIQVNAAPGMCDYIEDSAYTYFDRPAGYGPRLVQINYNEDTPASSSCKVTNNAGAVKDSTVGGSGVTMSGNLCTFPGGTITADGTTTSTYDYTTSDGPSCTEGKYNLIVTTTLSGATTTASTTNLSWGGLIGNCIGTPAKAGTGLTSGWSINTKYNAPIDTIYNAQLGFNRNYQITPPYKFSRAGNWYAANFYGWAEYALGHQNTATIPTAMAAQTDLLGNVLGSSNPEYASHPAYTFYCLDTAHEVKQKIRLYINEWDIKTQFAGYGSNSGSFSYSPIATAGQVCDGTAGDCNDVPSWPDLPSSYPFGDYNSSTN